MDGCADRIGAVGDDVDLDGGWDRCLQHRHHRLDPLDSVDDVGAGLALDRHDDRALVVVPAGDQVVFRRADGAADVTDADRRAISVSDHQIGVIVRVQQLIVGVQRIGLARAVERAFRQVDIGLAERRADVLQIDAARGKRLRIELHPHGGLLLAAEADEADARYLRNLLQQDVFRIGVHRGQRQAVRGQAEYEDRRIGRIDLADRRRVGNARRQKRTSGVDCRQRIADRSVDLAVQIELQRDLGVAKCARRRHLGETRNLAELEFERRRDRRRHGLRIGTRQLRRDLKRRIVDVRQRCDRQQRIGDQAADQKADHQERGRDRPLDEGCGYVHGMIACCACCAAASSAASPCRIVTWVPGSSRYCPSITTCSPAFSPESISASPSAI